MSFRKDIVLQLGTITTMVNIDSAVDKDDATGLKTVCVGEDAAHTHAPTAVRQDLKCPSCLNNDRATFKKAKVDGTAFTVVEADEVAATKATANGAGKKIIQLLAHPSSEVRTQAIQNGSVYYLSPSNAALAPLYSLLVDFVKRHPETSFLGQWVPTSRANLYEIKVLGDTLVMEERARPEQIKVVQQAFTAPAAEHQKMMDDLLPTLTTPFKPELYTDTYAEQLAALIASKTAVDGVVAEKTASVPKVQTTGVVDLTALLTNALANSGTAA